VEVLPLNVAQRAKSLAIMGAGSRKVAPQRVALPVHPNTIGNDRGAVALVDMNGKETVLSDGWASLKGLNWSPRGDLLE
jgi:hypothetical protein